MKTYHQIVIIGAGTAGIMTAGQLLKKDKNLDITIIDPAEMHYYKPAWTLVGAGTYDYKKNWTANGSVDPQRSNLDQGCCNGF
jgi:sulfide:quinone oxidoreductase